MGKRIEINGLFKKDRGRTYGTHINGCGHNLKVGKESLES
jgi:hypothetical protein